MPNRIGQSPFCRVGDREGSKDVFQTFASFVQTSCPLEQELVPVETEDSLQKHSVGDLWTTKRKLLIPRNKILRNAAHMYAWNLQFSSFLQI